MISPPESWLNALNVEFRAQNIDVRQRPFLALDRYCKDFHAKALAFNSQPATTIFDWFVANTKAEAHQVGSLFKGVYYYDSCFWQVDIFIGYGKIELDATESLQSMSAAMKAEMMSTPSDAWTYVLTWADSVDYGYGFDDMQTTLSNNRYAQSLLANGDRELRAAIAQLLEHRPNAKAAMSCRMAVEIFIKAFLVLKVGLSEPEIKAFSHNLSKLLTKVRSIEPTSELLSIEPELNAFPKVSDRYTGEDISPVILWNAYSIALHVAAVVARSFTDRDIKSSVLSQRRAP